MNMEVSDKDKQLLYIVAAIVIVALSYFFGCKNFTDKKDAYKAQEAAYMEEYSRLIELQKNREMYVNDTVKFEEDRADILTGYAEGYSNENFLVMISDLEEEDQVWINQMEFSDAEEVYVFATEEGMTGIRNQSSMKFDSGYMEFKAFVESLLDMDSKTCIDTIEVEYNSELEALECVVDFSHYSVATPNTVNPNVDIDLPVGVDNIFDSGDVTGSEITDDSKGEYILTDYDACVVVSPDKSDFDSIIVGTTNDAEAKDSLSTDENETTELTITFGGSEGNYTISYMLGDVMYPAKKYEEGAKLRPGSTLDLLILSSQRTDKNDKVAVKCNVINNSDMKLNVLVHNDDEASPRVSFAKREGDGEIVIYR